jgi:DNA-3-methyladenine glycosylase
MFGPAGHLYVYFTYGMHFCCNVVTGREGEGSAVLLRAVEPLEGVDLMRDSREVDDPRLLCAGPARLTRAFRLGREHNGVDLVEDGVVHLSRGTPVDDASVGVGPRVGIRVATDRPWRYYVVGSPFVSKAVRSGSGRARTRAGPRGG